MARLDEAEGVEKEEMLKIEHIYSYDQIKVKNALSDSLLQYLDSIEEWIQSIHYS